MSGSGEYTTTPNLGLFKPTYNADAENWGFHLNSNSDLLDAIVGGGTINVLSLGADPTYTRDSTEAFRQALLASASGGGRRKAVYFPAGVYRINGQLDLTACQAFYGDSRGSSVLMIDDQFDPAATAVLLVSAASYDAGPVLRDFGITFVQPQDQGSRANFKTLAAGGTSHPGGTGVKYPWAIASGAESFRIQCIRLRIGAAWDGITTNGHNTVFWLDDIEMGAFDCGVNVGDGPGVQDFMHINHYHFWTFEMGSALQSVYYDGQVISLRIGRCDGINITGYTGFCARIVFTGDGGYTHCQIANCMMDADQSTVEVLGTGIGSLLISNEYATAGTVNRLRPFLTMSGPGVVKINNHFSFSSAAYPEFLLSHSGADLTVSNFSCIYYTTDKNWALLQNGTMRILNGKLAIPGARSAPAIAETGGGVLVVDNVQLDDNGTNGTGVVLSMVTASPLSMVGRLAFSAGATWTVSLPAGLATTHYASQEVFRGDVSISGAVFGNGNAQFGMTGGGGVNLGLVSVAGGQKALLYYRGGNLAWGVLSSGATDDFSIGRWNDTGVYQGNALGINRATGAITIPGAVSIAGGVTAAALNNTPIGLTTPSDGAFNILGVVGASYLHGAANGASYANDAAAAAGGIGMHQTYRNGSAVMVRVT